jgi:membrane complex biogenesis BtpA family protein
MRMSTWLTDLFETEKPIIAMAHLPALPGTPRFDAEGGMAAIVEHVRRDVEFLVQGDVDAIMFSNEDDRPYALHATFEQIASFTRVVADLAPAELPFGVDFMWDPLAAMAIAQATGALFIREILTGAFESDMGIWAPSANDVLRMRRSTGAEQIRVLYNVTPEHASPLGNRTPAQRAASAVVSCLADGILISGPMAGVEPGTEDFGEVKSAVGDVPVMLNTGSTVDNIGDYLAVADGVVVGSSLKVDGNTWNPVDPARVVAYMTQVRAIRGDS